jgi:hypothetical protein
MISILIVCRERVALQRHPSDERTTHSHTRTRVLEFFVSVAEISASDSLQPERGQRCHASGRIARRISEHAE